MKQEQTTYGTLLLKKVAKRFKVSVSQEGPNQIWRLHESLDGRAPTERDLKAFREHLMKSDRAFTIKKTSKPVADVAKMLMEQVKKMKEKKDKK